MLKLISAQKDCSYKVVKVDTGTKIKKRLSDIGLFEGGSLKVIKFSAYRHNILVLCGGVFLGLRHDIAKNITVTLYV